MKTKISHVLRSTIPALSIGALLAGCMDLPNAASGYMAGLNAGQRGAVQSMVTDYLVASQINQDLSDADLLSESAMTAQAGRPAGLTAKQQEARARYEQRSKSRLEQKRQKMKGKPTVTVDGNTVTKVIEFEHPQGTKKHAVVKVYADEAHTDLVSVTSHLEQQHAKGMSFVIDRVRTRLDDGSWSISYNAVFTRQDGKIKTVAWTRTEAADGTLTGSGTISRFNGTTVAITFEQGADGTVVSRTIDAKAKVSAEVTQDEAAAKAEVAVKDLATGKFTGKEILNIEDGAPSEE